MAELKIKADSGGGTVSFKGPATTTGNAAFQLTLPVDDGAANQYLKTDGSGALSWSKVAGTSIAMGSDAAGDVLYHNGTDYIRLAKGTDGQVLTLASGVPTWAAATGYDNTPAFSAWLNADQNIDHDTETKVVFDSEIYDTDSAYNTSTGVFTVPSGEGGKYFISTQIWVDDITENNRAELYLYIDGSKAADYWSSWSSHSSSNGQVKGSTLTNTISLNAAQTVSIYAYHTSGSQQHLQSPHCWFTMFKLAGV